MPKTARERICPPPQAITELELFEAKVRYFVEERHGDLAFSIENLIEIIDRIIPNEKVLTEREVKSLALARTQAISKHPWFHDGVVDHDPVLDIRKMGKWLEDGLSQPHEGDCVACPCACTRCHTESYLGLPTSSDWTNKSEGWALYCQYRAELEKENASKV